MKHGGMKYGSKKLGRKGGAIKTPFSSAKAISGKR